ncbi:MAG: hypothetical protein ABR592_08205 [Nitriliruptorales bacterium]
MEGDLVAAGGQVQMVGRVGGDLVMAGGSLTVPGEVGGDIRAAGGQFTMSGSAGEDLLFAGGQASVSGTVGDDLIFSAGQTRLDGQVSGDVLGNAGTYERQGTVGGTEDVTVGEKEKAPPSTGERILAAFRRYVAVLVVGALFLWLAPALLQAASSRLRQQPLPSLAVGLLEMVGFVLIVLVAVLVAVLTAVILGLLGLGSLAATTVLATLLGVGALSLAFVVAVVFVADAVAGLTLGRLVSPGGGKATPIQQLVLMALGVLPVVGITALPVVGGWVRLLVVLFGLGALLLGARSVAAGRRTGGRAGMAQT